MAGAISTASPARQCGVGPSSPRNARMGRKSRLLAHLISSPDSQFADLGAQTAESLQPCPQTFPFCGDYRRRLGAITTAARERPCNLRALISFRAKAYQSVTGKVSNERDQSMAHGNHNPRIEGSSPFLATKILQFCSPSFDLLRPLALNGSASSARTDEFAP